MAEEGATGSQQEQQHSGGFEPPIGEGPKANSNDEVLAAIIFGAAIAVVIIGGIWYRNKSKKSGGDALDDLMWESSGGTAGDASGFKPPKERQSYLDAREKLDLNKPENAVMLKKLLMMRAMKTLPMLYELQNGGPSVDRLYKKGMLTDSMHSRFVALKQYIDEEFAEVQEEADRLVEGWGQAIWPQANQYYQIHQRQASGKDDKPQTGPSNGGGDGDDTDSIVKALSPKKNRNTTINSSSKTRNAAGSGSNNKGKNNASSKEKEKEEKDRAQAESDAKATKAMNEAEKAEYYANKLLKEEEGGKKSGGKGKK